MKGHLLIIGQNPGRMKTTDPRLVPMHKALGRWCDHLEVRHYSFVNVQHRQGEWCPLQDDLDFLQGCISYHDGPILALGGKVWGILKDIYGTRRHGALRGPHPSGRNRNFNDIRFEMYFLGNLYDHLAERT